MELSPPPGAPSPVTCRPQAANAIATSITAKPNLRYIFTSRTVRATALALPCAFVLHLAFPRANLPWLAPLALGGLFAAWMITPPRTAAAIGYIAGLLFFALDFSWFGESAGVLLGPLAPLLDIGPAAVEALAFALAAAVTSLAAARLGDGWVPLVGAAGFTVAELLRSSGVLGAPLYQIGAAFVDTPLAPIAAVGGVYALTFSVALIGSVLGAAIANPNRAAANRVFATLAFVAVLAAAAWLSWPARTVKPGTLRVAAVQGNIRQSIKWQSRSLALAVARYTDLTLDARAFHPQFVLWPETVITTELRLDPELSAVPANADLVATDRRLNRQFTALANSLNAVIAVGSTEATAGKSYNDLFFFTPQTTPTAAYRKRRLVPFAEFLPGPSWLRALPFAALVSDFGAGTDGGPFAAELQVAPLICWEADFGDLAQRQAAAGARFFAISTDDAWFGDSDGPYAHAQISQLRALETGRWIVRAAATGISGIIGPDGHWRERSRLNTPTAIVGTIGEPQPTLYSRIGPLPIGILLAALAIAGFGLGRRRVR